MARGSSAGNDAVPPSLNTSMPADIAQIARHRGGLAAAQGIAAAPAAQDRDVLFPADAEGAGRRNDS